MKLRQHFHALVFDRMKVFQNYFLSSARKKVNKKKNKKKERKKNWTLRGQGGKIITLKTLRTNDLILVLSICNYCARKKNTSSSAEAQNLPVLFARRPHAIVQLLSTKIVHFYDKSMKLCQITTNPKTNISGYGAKPNSTLDTSTAQALKWPT